MYKYISERPVSYERPVSLRPAASRSLETAASAPWLRPEPRSRSKNLDRLRVLATAMASVNSNYIEPTCLIGS